MIEGAIEELKYCDPPLFTEDSYLDKKTDQLIIYKATNSPGEAPKKVYEAKSIKTIESKSDKNSRDVELIMHRFNMTEEEVVSLNNIGNY